MSQLVANEAYQYYKTRLPNEYLISGGVYMSSDAHNVLVNSQNNERLIQDAIAENQFSTGAMNHLYEIINQAFPSENTVRDVGLSNLRTSIDRWLLSIDLTRAVIK